MTSPTAPIQPGQSTITDSGFGRPPVAESSHATAALGMEYNPFDPQFRANPHVFFDKAREQAPVCFNPIFNMWLVTRHAEVMTVCSDEDTFSSGNKVDPPASVLPEVLDRLNTEGFPIALQLFNSDLPGHTRLRTLVGQSFTTSILNQCETTIATICHRYLSELPTTQPVDLYDQFTNPYPMTVLLNFLGVPPQSHDAVIAHDLAWAHLFTSAFAIDDQMEAVESVIAYQHLLDDLVEQRRTHPQDDLISRCVHATHRGFEPLTNAEIVWQCMGLLAAGHATTTDALTHLLLLLLQNPAMREDLTVHPGRADAYIEESLRFVNPVLGLPRLATRDVELGGVTIPAGADVLVSFCSANRDPAAIPNPGTFDATRPNVRHHLGFGWGTHHCIGARMAKSMMSTAVRNLIKSFPEAALAPGYAASYNEHPFLWGLSNLDVLLKPTVEAAARG